MKVILVNGSPKKEGCTFTALSEIKKTLAEEGIDSEIYHIGTDIVGCRACGACSKLGKCVIDDKVNEFTEMAKNADGFIFGSPVHYAAASGNVIISGWNNAWGNYIVINHGGGITTLYAHNSALLVSKGQYVTQGQTIARVGSTGYSTGPHIHFEVQVNGRPVNPMSYFN